MGLEARGRGPVGALRSATQAGLLAGVGAWVLTSLGCQGLGSIGAVSALRPLMACEGVWGLLCLGQAVAGWAGSHMPQAGERGLPLLREPGGTGLPV